jgi:phosphate transport system substrate-binding protein
MRFYLLSLIVIMFSCVSNDGTIKLKGSDTEVNLAVTMAETFRKENKNELEIQ